MQNEGKEVIQEEIFVTCLSRTRLGADRLNILRIFILSKYEHLDVLEIHLHMIDVCCVWSQCYESGLPLNGYLGCVLLSLLLLQV